MKYQRCVVCYEYVGWIGLVTNLLLSMLKLFVGLVSGSHALIADSLYSAKDIITSVLIIIGLKISKRPIDPEHPYGHGKIEFIFSAVISVVFIGVTGTLLYYAASSLIEGAHAAPHLIALWTAVLSMVICGFLYKYTKCVAAEINSPIVNTLSKHYLSDGQASFAVAAAIIGAHYLGMPWLDSAVAILETVHLLYMGGEVFWESIQGMLDSSAPKVAVEGIRGKALGVSGVKSVEELKTRMIGQELWVDMIVGVDPESTIFDAKTIAESVEDKIVDTIPHIGTVNVHFKSLEGSLPELGELLPRQDAATGAQSGAGNIEA